MAGDLDLDLDLDLAAVYAANRAGLAHLLRSLPDDDLLQRVPACPAWRVRDVAAHLVGVAADVLDGRLDPAASDRWTAEQVGTRAEVPLDGLLAEWAQRAELLQPRLAGIGRFGAIVTVDAVTHRWDVHGALGLPAPAYAEAATEADRAAFRFALESFAGVFGRRVTEAELPAVRLRDGGWSFRAGRTPEGVEVTAPAGEMFRALAGRRSEAQIRAWAWSADPGPYLPILSPFGPPAGADVVEGTPYPGSS